MASHKADRLVTIKDVAERAGVSLMTVSRVIRQPDVVAEVTRERVQMAIDELAYIPDLAAGRLSSQKSQTVAVVLPSLHFEGHARTVDGLSRVLRERGYHLLIGDNFYSRREEAELLRVILGRRPAGIVLINSAPSDAGRNMLMKSGVPVIETWDFPDNPIDSVVGFSHTDVGEALAAHLVDNGYTRIGFIGGPEDSDPRGRERRAGVKRLLDERGLDTSRFITLEHDHLSIEAGTRGVEKLLERHSDTDALICLTDRVAMGALHACRERGLSVPADLAIVGHGGFDFGAHLTPSLTTTCIDAVAIGENAARLLLKRVDGNRLTRRERRLNVGFEVVARESSTARGCLTKHHV